MLDYASLAAVAAVVREGSFEQAASALGVTPSAVSQRVRALEERLGTVLVRRSQPAEATETGARLCAHVERVRLLEGEVLASLPELRATVSAASATLRVAVNADSLATWFVPAVAAFAARDLAMLDLVTEDEAHTAERLRTGEVLAAVTTDAKPVQGCRTVRLGALRYAATASPAFMARHFAKGVDDVSLARAPVLRFDRRDDLQARFMREVIGAALEPPTYWVPTSAGFVDLALAGVGWGMNPLVLARPHLASGRLVELAPGRSFDVPLAWQHARIGARLLEALTRDVVAAARKGLVRPAP